MLGLLSLAVTVAVAWFGYGTARRFVRERLRFVDAALTAGAAVVAGLGATLVAWPVAAVLPVVTTGTALSFGLAVGLGARAGARDVKDPYRLRG